MDFSKVDWMHVIGLGAVAAVAGPALLGAAGITAAASALGIGLTGAGLGIGVGTVSALGQAKGAGTAAK